MPAIVCNAMTTQCSIQRERCMVYSQKIKLFDLEIPIHSEFTLT
jgi:hypothetical protein